MKKTAHIIEIKIKRGLDFAFSRAWVENAAAAVLTAEKVTGRAAVDILVTDDRQIHKMNRLYRGIDRPTDVLSFALAEKAEGAQDIVFPEEQDGINNLGQIIISFPRVIEQAAEHSVSQEEEMTLLIVHGMLHLLGYNHEDNADARRMRRREKAITAHLKQGPANE